MAKYSYELKLKAVKEYISGERSYRSISDEYGIKNVSSIKN